MNVTQCKNLPLAFVRHTTIEKKNIQDRGSNRNTPIKEITYLVNYKYSYIIYRIVIITVSHNKNKKTRVQLR